MGLESISHTANVTPTSNIQRPMYMTPLILKLKPRRNLTLGYEPRVLGMLRYSIVASLAVRLNLWGRKAFHILPI